MSLATLIQYALLIGIPLLFIGVLLYVYRPWARRRYRQDAEIPFADDNHKHD